MTERIVIDHPHNEASALLGIQNREFLEHHGWDIGFWTVSDELPAAEAIAALGRTASGEWEVIPVRTRTDNAKKCEDCETLARVGSRIYVFGSQFGSKDGPLQPKRHFVARFNEALVGASKQPEVDLDLVRRPFAIHRLVNDALRTLNVALWPIEPMRHEAFVLAAIAGGREGDKAWRELVREDDTPVNVEGSAFVEGGLLLLGLRYPVTAEGRPIVVEIEGIDRLFEKNAPPPSVTAVRILANAGGRRHPAGIRELDKRDGWVHAITGDLDEELLAGGGGGALRALDLSRSSGAPAGCGHRRRVAGPCVRRRRAGGRHRPHRRGRLVRPRQREDLPRARRAPPAALIIAPACRAPGSPPSTSEQTRST